MKLLKLLWRWSWILTLPIVIIFVSWSGTTIERYYTFSIKYPSLFSNLYSYGSDEFQHLMRQTKLILSGQNGSQQQGALSLKTINLFIPEANLARLNESLPQSGFNYVKGSLWDGIKLHKIKLKYRGDNSIHWEYYKKSLRIKTKKSYLFEGMRSFNLVIPKFEEKLHNYLGYQFAKELGLIAPRSELVNVVLNGELLGFYILVEKLEELTLRNNNLMPADLYSGELVGMDQYFGISPEVFLHPRLWGKNAVNNHYPEDSYRPMEKLVELVNTAKSERVQQKLSRLLDMDAWGRFAAYETLTQSFHYDDQHNWRLYYDPYRRCFVPIIWDPVAWHNNWRPGPGEKPQLDILTSKLHTVLFENGDFLRARDKAIKDFFNAGKDTLFLQKVDQAIKSITPALLVDPNIRPTNPQQSIDAMQRLRAGIERTFAGVKQGYLEKAGIITYDVSSNSTLQLNIDGRQLPDALILSYAKPIGGSITAQLHYFIDNHKVTVDISGSLSIEGNRIKISKGLLPQFISIFNDQARTRYQRHRKKVISGYYELELTGIDRRNALISVYGSYGGTLTRALEKKQLIVRQFEDMYRIAPAQPLLLPQVWQGNVVIEKSLEIQVPLIIRPGTAVYLSPGVTVILRNKLIAEGTTEKPIRFFPTIPGQKPWGAIVLWGKGAVGSRLSHCEFTGGSGEKADLYEYTAMLSIHDVKGVEVENCIFRDSKITDDMVHTVYSEVRFKNCRFENSLMDALDVDISDVVVDHCYFSDSGNDSIDLMTSNAVVIDTIIENGGDKAASVGEGSKLLAINNIFRNNVIGVQAKDGSVVAIYNTDLTGNDHALDAYKKNWRYNDGGKIYVYKSRLEKNKKMITADKKSKIRVFDSYIDKPVAEKKKRIKLDDTVDSHSEHKAKINKLVRYKKEVKAMKNFDSRYWDHVDMKRRGAVNVANH